MKPLRCTLAVLTLALTGCAIQQLQADIDNTHRRIDHKERSLAIEEQNFERLNAERTRLMGTLSRSESTASELRAQLERMRRLNADTPGATAQQRDARAERSKRLDAAIQGASVVERDQTSSAADKQKKLQELKAKTRVMMDVLLQG